MRFLLLASAASLIGGSAMGQSLLGQSQPGGAQSQAVIAVPEPPPVVAAPAAAAPQPVPRPAVAPPPGLVQTKLPPQNMVQPPAMPSDNAGSAPAPVPVPVSTTPVSAQAVSPSAPVAQPKMSQAEATPASASATAPSAAASPVPGSTTPAALPENDVAPVQENSWVYGHTAELGVLNKVDGSTETITVPVGGQVTSGDLMVSVQACVMRPPGELPNAAVYLTLLPIKADDSTAPVYKGWIVKSVPGAANSENADEAFRVINCS